MEYLPVSENVFGRGTIAEFVRMMRADQAIIAWASYSCRKSVRLQELPYILSFFVNQTNFLITPTPARNTLSQAFLQSTISRPTQVQDRQYICHSFLLTVSKLQ